MARAKFNPGELDQNLKIEQAIRSTLRESPIATVSTSVVDTEYERMDEEGNPINATVEEKCDQLSQICDARYRIAGDDIHFTPRSAK